MKNILKTFLHFSFFSFLIISCSTEQTSTKGNWSSSDIKKCKEYLMPLTGKVRENAEKFWASEGKSLEENITCSCEKMQENYESYEIAVEKLNIIGSEEYKEFMRITIDDCNGIDSGPIDDHQIGL
tara:strand:+ start:1378 stop:1755 length:378 start_codon:yes stop_codon:yes gene_type:complete